MPQWMGLKCGSHLFVSWAFEYWFRQVELVLDSLIKNYYKADQIIQLKKSKQNMKSPPILPLSHK